MGAPDPEPIGRCELCGFPVWGGSNPQLAHEEPKIGEAHDPTGYCEGIIVAADVWSEELMAANQADILAAQAEAAAALARAQAEQAAR